MAEIHSMVEIKETTKWLQELLQKERANGIMSRSTEARIEHMVKIYTEIVETGLKCVREDVNLRLESDEKYYKQRMKLEAMVKEAWYLRYGEYFSRAANELPERATTLHRDAVEAAEEAERWAMFAGGPNPNTNRQAAEASPEDEGAAMKTFLEAPWELIHNIIQIEHDRRDTPRAADVPAPATPMLDLVEKLSDMTAGFNYTTVYASIEFYATYDDDALSPMDKFPWTTDLCGISSKMVKDYTDLILETCITSREREDARKCIRVCMGRYFETFRIRGKQARCSPWPVAMSANGEWTCVRGTGGVLIVDGEQFSLDDCEECENDEGGEVEGEEA